MKTQKVSVDIWAMVKSMLGYVALTILGGIFIRLVVAAITLPQRLRAQRANVEKAMDELKLKYPEAFKEIAEELEIEEKEKSSEDNSDSKKTEEDAAIKPSTDNSAKEDDKRSIDQYTSELRRKFDMFNVVNLSFAHSVIAETKHGDAMI